MITGIMAVALIQSAFMRAPYPVVCQQFTNQHVVTDRCDVRYRLYYPDAPVEGPVPLVIWFHGRGERGTDNVSQLAWCELLLEPLEAGRSHCPVAILAVQDASGKSWTTSGEGLRELTRFTQLSYTDRVEAALRDVLRRFEIDGSRLYLMGISEGAVAGCQFAAESTERFAAMVLLGPSREIAVADATPENVWIFQSRGDGAALVAAAKRFAKRVRDSGNQARCSIVESAGHNCWTAAFRRHGVLRWLQCQSRESTESQTQPRTIAIVLALVLLAMRRLQHTSYRSGTND